MLWQSHILHKLNGCGPYLGTEVGPSNILRLSFLFGYHVNIGQQMLDDATHHTQKGK